MTATTAIICNNIYPSAGTMAAEAASEPPFSGDLPRRVILADFTVSSYTSGGEALPTAQTLGLTSISAVMAQLVGTSVTTGNSVLRWDSTNGKLISVGNVAAGTETANGFNLGLVKLMVIGY